MNTCFDSDSLVMGSIGGGVSHLESFRDVDLNKKMVVWLNKIAVLIKEFYLNRMLQVQCSGPTALR